MALTSRQTEQLNHAFRGDGVRSDIGTTLATALLKLDGVEALADVTDATNVAAALAAGASGAVKPANIEGLAHTASTLRARTKLTFTFNLVAADFTTNNDLVLTVPSGHDILITDVNYLVGTAEGGAATATLRTAANGGGTAISSALNLNASAGTIQRTTTVTAGALAAGASIYVNCSTNPGTCAGVLVIEYVHTT